MSRSGRGHCQPRATAKPLPMTPLPVNRAALGQDWVGKPIRVVGYGNQKGGTEDTSGTRKQATQAIDSLTAETVVMAGDSNLCHGDSGGPALIR